jgi:sugar lactone lactonase YvrE
MGLAQGPDGSLYIGDTEKGRIWKVTYKGSKAAFGISQLAEMQKRKLTGEAADNSQSFGSTV